MLSIFFFTSPLATPDNEPILLNEVSLSEKRSTLFAACWSRSLKCVDVQPAPTARLLSSQRGIHTGQLSREHWAPAGVRGIADILIIIVDTAGFWSAKHRAASPSVVCQALVLKTSSCKRMCHNLGRSTSSSLYEDRHIGEKWHDLKLWKVTKAAAY